jgi:hypothetical protein
VADQQLFMDIRLEITMFELHRFEPYDPPETLLYRLACRHGLLPDHPYTVASIRGGLAVKIRQVVHTVAKEA